MKEYVREDTSHINGIEGFWSYANTWLYHYRGVPKQYFHLYLKEIEFRFNHRNEDIFRLLANILVKTVPSSSPPRALGSNPLNLDLTIGTKISSGY